MSQPPSRMFSLSRSLIATLVAIVALIGPSASAQPCDARWLAAISTGNGINGTVYAIAVLPNGDLVAGGTFTTAGGVAANSIVQWTGTSWSPLGTGIDGSVYALAVLSNGQLVAGGDFVTAGGVPANSIARWNGSSWSAFGSGVNGIVTALAVQNNGTIVAGGTFRSLEASDPEYLARWTGTSWASFGSGVDGAVISLAILPNGNLVAGGEFTTAGGVAAPGIARWNGSSWSALGSGLEGVATALAAISNEDIVASDTTFSGSTMVSRVKRWNGASWSSLGLSMNGRVHSLAVIPNSAGVIVAGGEFTTAGAVNASYIAQWSNASWSSFDTSVGGVVQALAVLRDGTIVAGGSFDTAIARMTGRGWLFYGLSGPVESLAILPNGDLVAGSKFTTAELWKWDGASWSSFGPSMYGATTSIAVLENGDLAASGSFDYINTPPLAASIAKWNGSSWSRIGLHLGITNSLVSLPNNDLVAAGNFTSISGVSASRIARWNGVSWSSLGTGVNNSVSALAVLPGGDLVAGGFFTTAGGSAAGYIARWDGASWSALGLGVNGPVRAVTVLPNGDLIAGGSFTSAGGVPANGIARWDGSSWSPLGLGLNGTVFTLASLNGDLIAGGFFTTAGGAPANCIARWNGSYWLPFDSGVNSQVSKLAVLPNGDLVAGGYFSTAGNEVAERVAIWREPGDADGDGIPDDWECNGVPYPGIDGHVKRYLLDVNNDGISDASPRRKDIFVEVDSMFGRAPYLKAISDVVGAFDQSPVPATTSNGLPGIALHVLVDAGDQDIPLRPYPRGFDDFQDDKNAATHGFGTDSERANPDWLAIREAKAQVFRYCIFADTYNSDTSSGLAEGIVCNDFMVTLGSNPDTPGGTVPMQAGTFMHELGHTLGLRHGGGRGVPTGTSEDTNYKPNYYSVMNYFWQWPKSWMKSTFWWRLDYSRSALPTLVEGALIETQGLQAHESGVKVPYRTSLDSGLCYGKRKVSIGGSDFWVMFASMDSGFAVDWDGDCNPRTPGLVMYDVNDFSGFHPIAAAILGYDDFGYGMTSLHGHDDWSNLVYSFRDSDHFDDGARAGENICRYDKEVRNFLDSIPPPPPECASDLNDDGLVDDADFSVFAVAYDVLDCAAPAMPAGCPADLNRDGIVNDDDFQVFVVAYNAVLCP